MSRTDHWYVLDDRWLCKSMDGSIQCIARNVA